MLSIFYRNRENQLRKIKAAKKRLKSTLTATYVLYLIILHIDGNVDKKFQPSIFYRSREKIHTDVRIDGHSKS